MTTNKQMHSKLGTAAIALSAFIGGLTGLLPGLFATDSVISILGGSLFGCVGGTLAFIPIATIAYIISSWFEFSIYTDGAACLSNAFLVAAIASLAGMLSALTTHTVSWELGKPYNGLAAGGFVTFLTVLFITFVLIPNRKRNLPG